MGGDASASLSSSLASLRHLAVTYLPKRWGGQADYSDALGGALSSKDSLEYVFRVPADSAAGDLLQRDAEGVRALAEAEERVLLVKLSARLQAASIAAGGLLLTSTQHDSCIAKLGLMQAVAVLAAASRYTSALRRAVHAQVEAAAAGGAVAAAAEEGGSSNGSSRLAVALRGDVGPESHEARVILPPPLGKPTTPATPGARVECRWTSQPTSAASTTSTTSTTTTASAEQPAEPEATATTAGTAAAASRLPKPPVGVWTTLRLEQLPSPAAHWVRQEAMRTALALRLQQEGGAPAGAELAEVAAAIEIEHAGVCGHCGWWQRAYQVAARTVLAVAAVAALLVARGVLGLLLPARFAAEPAVVAVGAAAPESRWQRAPAPAAPARPQYHHHVSLAAHEGAGTGSASSTGNRAAGVVKMPDPQLQHW
ncbi:hypothetical protein HXX76_002095 [Chlamydomonas incerta]|uniref:Uncharacterized protein n=1 Tax=Chlamydomonas incerta TaxID=51695 RepID=A0A835WAG0_CHLIN|nr:hypothetical protein HXX76_002095 [Chlamydomonas incerta]|eukprot:KAG2443749.1 hypothetical protein HXX76_002095 [Chlamydomonas incerta]